MTVIIVFCNAGHAPSKLAWFTRSPEQQEWQAVGLHGEEILTGLGPDGRVTPRKPVRYRLGLACARCRASARFRWEQFTPRLDALAEAGILKVSLAGLTATRRTGRR